MMNTLSLLLIASLWTYLDALSVCTPVNSIFILSSDLIDQSQDHIGSFFHDLVYDASSELSGVGVLAFGDVAGEFENPLLGLTETIGANTAHTMAAISKELSVDEVYDEAMEGHISLTQAIESAHDLFVAESAGREMEAMFVMDLVREDNNRDSIAECISATEQIEVFAHHSNSSAAADMDYAEGLYFVRVNEQMEVVDIFDCFAQSEIEHSHAGADATSELHLLTCPSKFKIADEGTVTLSGKVQLIELVKPDENLIDPEDIQKARRTVIARRRRRRLGMFDWIPSIPWTPSIPSIPWIPPIPSILSIPSISDLTCSDDDSLRCYAAFYPDLFGAFCSGAIDTCSLPALSAHWFAHGLGEGRACGCYAESLRCYVVRYPDLLNHFCSGAIDQCSWAGILNHWFDHGKGEGRTFGCDTAASVPFSVITESPAINKNVWVIDLRSLSWTNAWAASLLVLLLVLTMCVAYQKCSSSEKRTAYAKVQINDDEITTDEEQELNA